MGTEKNLTGPAVTRRAALALAGMAAGAFMCPAPALASSSSGGEWVIVTGSALWDQAADMLGIVNARRAESGVGGLRMSKALQQAAMQRAVEIAFNFSHTRPDGEGCFTAYPDDYTSAAENVAKGQTSAEAVMASWMGSGGHRSNILDSGFGYIGIAGFYWNGIYYWAQAFADSGSPGYVSRSRKDISAGFYCDYSLVDEAWLSRVKRKADGLVRDKDGCEALRRMYNPYTGEHFYTASVEEAVSLMRSGWEHEGLAWYAPESSSEPVYRLYNPYTGDHHYTANKAEYDGLGKAGWRKEGVAFRSAGSSGVKVYRLYNPYAPAFNHHYTTNKSERDSLAAAGWRKEGTAFYAESC